METQVLKKNDLAWISVFFEIQGCKGVQRGSFTVFLVCDSLLDFGTNTVIEEENLLIEEFLQFLCNRFQGELLGRFPVRPAEMGHQGDCLGFVVRAVLDGRQCRDNTLIVCDFVRSSLLLRNLRGQWDGSGGLLRYIEVDSTQQ